MKRKAIIVITGIMMFITLIPVFSFAGEIGGEYNSEGELGEKTIHLETKDLSFSKQDERQITQIGEDIKMLLQKQSYDDYEKIIAEVSESKEETINNYYEQLLSDAVTKRTGIELSAAERTSSSSIPEIVIDERVFQALIYTFPISDTAVLEISPAYVSLEVVEKGDNDIRKKQQIWARQQKTMQMLRVRTLFRALPKRFIIAEELK